MKRIKFIAVFLIILATGFTFIAEDYFFKIDKSIEIFGKLYKEVVLNYVDEVDPEKFMKAGIKGMLSALDPYTVFIDEKHSKDVDVLTSGKYGGIGITITMIDSQIAIVKVMEGFAGDKAGLKVGDIILEVDGVSLKGKSLDEARSMMLGRPGTVVRLKVKRWGVDAPLEFQITREEIKIKSVSYYGFVDDGIAYVKLDRFSRGAGEELRKAIRELKSRGKIKGFILDLRNNPGGLLDVAVNVVEKFIPKGSLVVSTRGRKEDAVRNYYSTEEPMLPDVPLCVLVNGSSASASEIVAGAIQDLDRGVILGERTFGKGLVQTISYLAYNTFLKMTTAKYYTPSGRCIQRIDYFHKPNSVFITKPDTLPKVFKTKNGRKVYGNGGITPDTVVAGGKHSDLFVALVRKGMFFKFANYYAGKHKVDKNFEVDDKIFEEFKKFVKANGFNFKDSVEVALEGAIAYAKRHNYSNLQIAKLKSMLESVKEDNFNAFDRNKDELKRELEREILLRYMYERDVIEHGLRYDRQLKVAISILKNRKIYNSLLEVK